ncbi:hypothetical protein VZ95_20400, partial [Elstera litoralis]
MTPLTIGIEKEYTIVKKLGKKNLYSLRSPEMVSSIGLEISTGWQLRPEYSRALIELISPPYEIEFLPALENTFAELDEALLSYRDAEDTWISDKHSVALEDFMLPDGKVTTDLREILFHQDSIAYLHSLVERLAPPPGKFGGKTPDVLRLYAGFSA